jgi:hypothetical protein
MSMGEPQAYQVPPSLIHLVQQWPGGVVRRVKENRLLGSFIRNQEAVGHGDPTGVGQYDHAEIIPPALLPDQTLTGASVLLVIETKMKSYVAQILNFCYQHLR